MAKQNSTYFSPTCFFCGKNNKRRHSRVGRTWMCGHCGEVNPGPGMVRSMMAKLGGHGEKREPVAPAAAPVAPRKAAATRIKGLEIAPSLTAAPPAVKTKSKPAAAPAAAQKSTPTRQPSAPPPAPKRGFLDRVVYGG